MNNEPTGINPGLPPHPRQPDAMHNQRPGGEPLIQHEPNPALGPESLHREARHGIGHIAVETIRQREVHATGITQAETRITELEALRPKNIISRLKQREALGQWLERHGYGNHVDAQMDLAMKKRAHTSNYERLKAEAEQDIIEVRKDFGTLDEGARQNGDILLRTNGIPEAIMEACDKTAEPHRKERNLLEWMSLPKKAEIPDMPLHATNKQVEEVLLWNAERTEALAKAADHIPEMVANYNKKLTQAVRRGTLAPGFANAVPQVKTVVIGDILDRQFLGSGGIVTRGLYDRHNQEITVWPYELPSNNDNIEEDVEHEVMHSLGKFYTAWINEAYTERCTRIGDGQDPEAAMEIYGHERTAVGVAMKHAPEGEITDLETSEDFLGTKDPAGNELALQQRFKKAYRGIDMLSHLRATYAVAYDTAVKRTGNISLAKYEAAKCTAEFALEISAVTHMVFTDPQSAQVGISIHTNRMRAASEAIHDKAVADAAAGKTGHDREDNANALKFHAATAGKIFFEDILAKYQAGVLKAAPVAPRAHAS